MPTTDTAPPAVVPDTRDGRRWVEAEKWSDAVAYCRHYDPDTTVAMARADAYVIHECKNRTPFGERRRQWCFKCPAGYWFIRQHLGDAAQPRDRVMRVSS